MAQTALLVGSLTTAPSARASLARTAPAWALEWRADLLGDSGSAGIQGLGSRAIYTLRSRAEGGEATDSVVERAARLSGAATRFDLVDLEADRDLTPEVLAAVPPEKRILSWHGPAASLGELRARCGAMTTTPARFYKLVPAAERPRDALEPLALLDGFGRDDVVAFASGEAGAWSRLLAPRLGGALVYAQAQDRPAAAGQFTLDALRDDYGLPELPAVSVLAGVVGRPVLHSLSPRLHNLMFRALGMDWLYVPFHVPIFGDFWLDVVESGSLEVLGFDLAALSVTAPFKEIALAVSGAASPLAEHVAAANSLARRGDVWEAECTDTEGVTAPLEARGVAIAGRPAAVVGAGGAGRAAVAALHAAGARVTLANRSPARGRRVARELEVEFQPLAELDAGGFEILVNATPLGSNGPEMPFEVERLGPAAVVVDLAYRSDGPTRLVEAVRAARREAIDGREVLLYQAAPQFSWMTGREFDLEAGRAAIGLTKPEAPPG